MDISFVIPVFNGETVISRMVSSILALPDEISFEVIIVDDGSEDGTPEVLRYLQDKQKNLQVITTPNAGQSHARNTGLSAAEGKYVFFADADDRILSEGVARIFAAAEKNGCDIISGTYIRIEEGKEPYRACQHLPDGMITRKENQTDLFERFKTESAFGYLWNKLFRREWLLENGILFDDTIPVYMEDHLFVLNAFAAGAAFYFLNEPVYEYYFEGESTTRKADPQIAEKSLQMLESYDRFLTEKNVWEENQDLYVPLAMRMICWAAFKNIRYEGASYKKIKERLSLFAEADFLRKMLEDPSGKRYLRMLPSFLQRCFFGLAFSLLKKKKEGLLAFFFVVCSPLMKAAAGSMVR